MGSIGVLTAGGDCPGLNAVIRAVTVRVAEYHDRPVMGILNGWDGLMEGRVRPLDRDSVRGILQRGGTILGTSRRDPYVHGDGFKSVAGCVRRHDIDGLVVVGGDGTLRTAQRLADEGLPVVAVPKTIDNDIAGTDFTFGFDTAVQIATEAIDRIATTAEAHNRVMLVEVMGRSQGWIATYSGLAGGADAILIPEIPYDLDAVADVILTRRDRGKNYSLVVVAEGIAPPGGTDAASLPVDAFGFARLGGVAYLIAPLLEELTGFEARVTVLGHLQRGGTPSAFDRVLGTRFGVAAADLAVEGASGLMVALRGNQIVPIPLREAVSSIRGIDLDIYDVAATFFG
ncbi:MAG TPA: ATP-dependent 6-phosphofructokinase [Acidimicrobiia bacterium]|jgi:6-phosphofructokinase 1|nr:ATP-dependent 6-phosphofructokinase [Acidimicrobiia bacterium]